MCIEYYIGIRGECPDAKLYLDDLPGINIVNASYITNEIELRPIDLVRKSFNLAQKEVIDDVLSSIGMMYNSIVGDDSYSYAGTYIYYGETNETAKIEVSQNQNDKFLNIHAFGFELVSDRAVTKDFVISDAYGVSQVITVNLVPGLNQIPLDMVTNSEKITITFDLNDIKIGRQQETYYTYCSPCQQTCSCDCASVQATPNIGFNLCVRCEADICKLTQYLIKELELPLLYKTGINYLLEAKMSNRINAYTRNKAEDIEHILTLWMGGYDNQANVRVNSMYKEKVKQAAMRIRSMLRSINSKIFEYGGSYICNTLPG